jgi:tetratricopeptide (TPR) repeat protein
MNRAEAGRAGRSWILLGLILVATAITYRGVVENDFVMDDFHTVRDNPAVRSLALAGSWFLSPHATSVFRDRNLYRPVMVTSHAIDYAIWGAKPGPYHLTNLLIHLSVVVFVFLLGRRIGGGDAAAVCAAAVVALHPINAEAVNYLSARSSSLSALFILAAIWAYERAMESGVRWWWAVALTFGALALGTKEVGGVLPLLVLVWERIQRPTSWRGVARRVAPWVVLVVVYGIVRTLVLSHAESAISSRFDQHILFAIKIGLTSLTYWFWPSGLAPDQGWPIRIEMDEARWLVLGAVGAALGTALIMRINRRVGWCVLWFWISLLPVGALAFMVRFFLYEDHRVYLPGIGLAWGIGIVFAAAITRRWASWPVARGAWIVTLGMLAAFAVRQDLNRTAVWVDSPTLWEDVLKKNPDNIQGLNVRGLNLLGAGHPEEALQAFARAVELEPRLPKTHHNLGMAYAHLGEWSKAIPAFEEAIRLLPRYVEAYLRLGQSYEALGRWGDALAVYERLVRVDPGEVRAWGRAGEVLDRLGRHQEAAERYSRALAHDPTNVEVLQAFGESALRLGRWQDARAAFEKVLSVQTTGSYATQMNYGMALVGLDADVEAIEHFRAAAVLEPGNPDPYVQIAAINLKHQRWTEAASLYEQALVRDPNHFISHLNLAAVAERLGDRGRAAVHYRAFVATVPPDPAYDALRTRAKAALARSESKDN